MKQNQESLEEEAARATELLRGKAVLNVWRHSDGEVVIQFNDGTRFFASALNDNLELSITGAPVC